MLSPRLASMVTVLVFSTAASAAVDLTTIPRRIVKEPAYRSRPKYCLLVFGREAKTRIWLVQDGPTLYVDRNGNGDLTEPNEKVAAEKNGADAEEGTYTFKVGDVRNGERLHKDAAGRENWSIPMTEKNGSISASHFSRDGKLLFGKVCVFERARKWDKARCQLKWWDATSGREVASIVCDGNDNVIFPVLSPDEQTLATQNWQHDT